MSEQAFSSESRTAAFSSESRTAFSSEAKNFASEGKGPRHAGVVQRALRPCAPGHLVLKEYVNSHESSNPDIPGMPDEPHEAHEERRPSVATSGSRRESRQSDHTTISLLELFWWPAGGFSWIFEDFR